MAARVVGMPKAAMYSLHRNCTSGREKKGVCAGGGLFTGVLHKQKESKELWDEELESRMFRVFNKFLRPL